MNNGQVRFYKDGYTDLRGKFEYASLNTDDLNQVQRFALLVIDPDAGAQIEEAQPPCKIVITFTTVRIRKRNRLKSSTLLATPSSPARKGAALEFDGNITVVIHLISGWMPIKTFAIQINLIS